MLANNQGKQSALPSLLSSLHNKGRNYIQMSVQVCCLATLSLYLLACGSSGSDSGQGAQQSLGCENAVYPNLVDSDYVLPFDIGQTYKTGLTNCSSSFHAAGRPDQFAFDFNMATETPFLAARAGTVVFVEENQPSGGGGAGNYVVLDHGDNTFAMYLHPPAQGIFVNVGDYVEQGQVLGVTGVSGLAGYPHLHFIVVKDDYQYPYQGKAVSFRNAFPADKVLQSFTDYQAQAY